MNQVQVIKECVIVLNLLSATGKLVVQSWLLKHRILLKTGMMDRVHKKKIVSLHSAVFVILWLWCWPRQQCISCL